MQKVYFPFQTSKVLLFQSIHKDMLQPHPHLIEYPEDGLHRVLSTNNHAFLIDQNYFLNNYRVRIKIEF